MGGLHSDPDSPERADWRKAMVEDIVRQKAAILAYEYAHVKGLVGSELSSDPRSPHELVERVVQRACHPETLN